MSYFLQRIRLAEISRSIVDHNLMAATSSGRPSYYAHVMAMDFELNQMIHNIPPFFQLDSYERSLDSNKASGIFIQAYLLNSLMHTARCKLHLAYLTSGPNNNPAYASSRDTCLKSARQIIRAETQLLRSQHPFVRVRLRLAAILHTVFMASIVLLMDACVNRPSSLQDEILHGDVAEALRIIEDARSFSLAAAKLHESLMQILAKYRAQQQQQQEQIPQVPLQQGGASAAATTAAAPVVGTENPSVLQRSDPLALVSNPTQVAGDGRDRGGSSGAFPDHLSAVSSQPAQSLDDPTYLDYVQWDDLFSGIASSPFF